MSYPTAAEVNGVVYPINTDYQTAKECFAIINDGSISDSERALAVIYKIFGFVPTENGELFLEKAVKFLQCGEESQTESDSAPDMDINYDEGFIEASFMMDYQVDLSASNMHYWKFADLLQGLSEECVLSRVRKIRNYDLSEISDEKERSKMAKAQEALKLPEELTADEKRAIDEFEALFNKDGDE